MFSMNNVEKRGKLLFQIKVREFQLLFRIFILSLVSHFGIFNAEYFWINISINI